MITPQDRFWAKVDFTDSCWLWIAGCNKWGYGKFYLNGRTRGAHRVAYEWCIGSIPEGLDLDHLCRIRNCVRPNHLEAVTEGENTKRGDTGIHERNKTHCPRNHEYMSINTYVDKRGKRNCKICNKQKCREYYWRKKGIKV